MQHLLTRALEESDYHAKRTRFDRENPASTIKRGIGFATFFHGSGFTGSGERRLNSEVAIDLDLQTGRTRILVSSTEFGQGTNTILCQVAAQTLGLPYEDVSIAQPDTHLVPNSGPTVASRTAMIVGKLVERASSQILETLRSDADLPTPHTPEDFRRAAIHYGEKHGNLEVCVRYQSPGDIFWDDEHLPRRSLSRVRLGRLRRRGRGRHHNLLRQRHQLPRPAGGRQGPPSRSSPPVRSRAASRRASATRSMRNASGTTATSPTTR